MRVESRTESVIRPVSIFISYARRDQEFREELGRHLSFLWRSGEVDPWHDRKISAGQDWAGEIDRHLREADIILLLVSADFADSDYCWDAEMQTAIIRHELGEATLVPVIVRPVEGWQSSPLGRLQALPTDGKPVSSWDDKDEAYVDVVRGIKKIIKDRPNNKRDHPSMVKWTLQISGDLENYPQDRIHGLSRKLRKATDHLYIMPVDVEQGSVRLTYLSTKAGYEAVRRLYNQGQLEEILEVPIEAIDTPIGATVRIEARTVSSEAELFSTFLTPAPIQPEKSIWPPFVMGLSYPVENFLELGFLLGRHPDHQLEQSEIIELQGRLGRYLNTMLVVSGENLNVNLSPGQVWGGLPQPLRGTELGRDLLEQDLELKRQVARLLYPGDGLGERFWSAVEQDDFGREIDTFLRVWIVPDRAAVHEGTENGRVQVNIEKMKLRVLCEVDYALLGSRDERGEKGEFQQDRVIETFRTTILPEVQRAVDTGPQFGCLRQIYSVLVLAKWIKDRAGSAMGSFIDSNDTKKFQLEGAEEAAERIQLEYEALIRHGGFHYSVRRVDSETGVVIHRVYVVGAISLGCA